jgi:hypothetical protein
MVFSRSNILSPSWGVSIITERLHRHPSLAKLSTCRLVRKRKAVVFLRGPLVYTHGRRLSKERHQVLVDAVYHAVQGLDVVQDRGRIASRDWRKENLRNDTRPVNWKEMSCNVQKSLAWRYGWVHCAELLHRDHTYTPHAKPFGHVAL